MTASAPLEYAKPPAFRPRIGGVCPICNERPVSTKTLYGFLVCKKCLYRFANRRQLAYIADSLLIAVPAIAFALAVERAFVVDDVTNFLVTLIVGLLVNVAFNMRDGFDGRSPGKRLTGVQVVDVTTGRPIAFGQSFRRNWWFLFGLIPVAGGLISFALVVTIVFQMNKGPRLGDRGARTRVIWRRYADSPVFGGPDTLCRSCGYDLTGNESGRCPECGVPNDGVPIARADSPDS